MNIVIANATGIDSRGYYLLHSPSRWSYGWKNYREVFTYYPWELAYTSSLLKRETRHNITFVDGCLKKYDAAEYIRVISELNPDYLVMEPSSRTLNDDMKVALKVKEKCGTCLIITGQHATAFPEAMQKIFDYVCIGEYEYTVLDIINGKKREEIPGLYPNERRELLDVNSLPWPEDTDVSRFDYAIPGEPNCEYKEIQMYATRGCPVMCAFCVCSNLYYAKPNYRTRNIDDIIAEIKYLRKKYPEMEGIFFDEEGHNYKREFVHDFCNALIREGLNDLKINAMCGYSTLDRETIQIMKKAGYYKLRVGIETASEQTAAGIGLKGKFNLSKLREILQIARDEGMKIYGTFTAGALGSTYEEDIKTANLVYELVSKGLLFDLQVSINTPLPGTPFYNTARENGWLHDVDWSCFDGGNQAVVSYPGYSAENIEKAFHEILSAYDRGREISREKIFKESVETEISKLPDGNYLFLRSSRMWQVNLFADEFFRNSGFCADILCQPAVKTEINSRNYRNIYEYTAGFFNTDIFKREYQKISRNYDGVIIFYNHPRGYGYTDVEEIASMCGKNVYAVFPDGKISEIKVRS